jgi:hypothetical protein
MITHLPLSAIFRLKWLIVFILSLGFQISIFAQSTPQAINYQAVARDNEGVPLSEIELQIEAGIIQGNPDGNEVYAETHTVTTDIFGLFNLFIGDGAPIVGDFSEINWGSAISFLRITIDDGQGSVELPTVQFLSVPYALYTAKADSAAYGPDDDTDPNNEKQDLELDGNILSITNNDNANPVDLSGINTDNQTLNTLNESLTDVDLEISNGNTINISIEDADADPNNERQDLEFDGIILSITNNVNATPINLSGISTDDQTLSTLNETLTDFDLEISDGNTVNISIEDADANPNNELQELSNSATGENRTIEITEGNSITFNIADGDNDDTNEFQTIEKSGNTVTLSNGGGSFSVDDGDSDDTNEYQELSNSASGENRTIEITDGNSITFNIADGDNDDTNEYQELSNSATGENRTIEITNGNSTTFNIADGDSDPANEKISSINLTPANVLEINEGSATPFVDLSALKEDENWTPTGNNISNSNAGNVGINKVNPTSTLFVNGTIGAKVRIETDGTYNLGDESIFIAKTINGNVTVFLPDATLTPGRIYFIKKGAAATSHSVIIRTVNGQTIDDQNVLILDDVDVRTGSGLFVTGVINIWQSAILVSDGSNWLILSVL